MVEVEDLGIDALLSHDLDESCKEVISKQVYVLSRAQAKQEGDEFSQGECELREYLSSAGLFYL